MTQPLILPSTVQALSAPIIKRTPVRAVKVEWSCPVCLLGMMTFTGKVQQTQPPTFLHKCSNCDGEAGAQGKQFPSVEFETCNTPETPCPEV